MHRLQLPVAQRLQPLAKTKKTQKKREKKGAAFFGLKPLEVLGEMVVFVFVSSFFRGDGCFALLCFGVPRVFLWYVAMLGGWVCPPILLEVGIETTLGVCA